MTCWVGFAVVFCMLNFLVSARAGAVRLNARVGLGRATLHRRFMAARDSVVVEDGTGCHLVTCKSEEEIEDLGARLSMVTTVGDVLLLRGDLGAGKTTLARGLIRHKFSDESMRVTSPSYLLDNSYEYGENQVIHHMDLYRLPTGCDLSLLGIPGIFSTCLCVIEWPQRMGGKLPEEYLDVDMTIGQDEVRHIRLTPSSAKWQEALSRAFQEL